MSDLSLKLQNLCPFLVLIQWVVGIASTTDLQSTSLESIRIVGARVSFASGITGSGARICQSIDLADSRAVSASQSESSVRPRFLPANQNSLVQESASASQSESMSGRVVSAKVNRNYWFRSLYLLVNQSHRFASVSTKPPGFVGSSICIDQPIRITSSRVDSAISQTRWFNHPFQQSGIRIAN